MANVGIPNPTWLSLLGRLGIQRFGQWALGDLVVPVALVDAASVTLNATALAPLFGTPASAGVVVNPAAATRLADTGALAAGNYSFLLMGSGTATADMRIRRRNATDAADIWTQRWDALGYTSNRLTARFTLANNERLVIDTIGAPVGSFQASIFAVAS